MVARPGRSRPPPAGAPRPDTPVADRLSAIRRLAHAAPPVDTAPLLRALADPEPVVRRAAAWALGTIRDPRTRTGLEASLGDPDPAVRGSIAEALGALGRAEARPALERTLADPEASVRSKAAWAL
ncbi:MAG TPA: HEAT repeat domain-containing protein, partial [Thermoplasmata archaeon]|nr:HEAT repeat domain-containing protein [Thermoplasmata archaeon]